MKRSPKASVPILVILLLMLVLALPCAADQGRGPRAAEKGLTADGDLQLGPHDRCPVCGMFPAKRPKAAAALQLADGRTFYFCGNGCLLRSIHDSQTHLGVAADRIARIGVRNYFTGAAIDGRSAIWVAGSDVIGPMGPALVTLENQADAEIFRQRHGGKLTFTLDQVDDALWRRILEARKP